MPSTTPRIFPIRSSFASQLRVSPRPARVGLPTGTARHRQYWRRLAAEGLGDGENAGRLRHKTISRMDVLRRVGDWDAWNVTEDADIGFRLARFGYDSETLTSTTYEEAPISLAAFFKQRRRWCKGWYQTFIVLWRQPRRLLQQAGFARSSALTLVLLANILGSLTAPLCAICLGADLLLGAKALPTNIWGDVLAALWTTVIVAGVPAFLWPALKGMKRRGLLHVWPVLLLLPAYSLIICAAAWTALYDLARRPHHWLKTEHGRGRRGTRGGVIRRRLVEPLCAGRGRSKNFRLTLSDISI